MIAPSIDNALLASHPKHHRRSGKIAQLPKDQRELINHLLDDGATYDAVAQEMATHGVNLNGENISNHFQGAYQEYLLHQDWLGQIAALRENADDLPCDAASDFKFHQAVLGLGVTQIFGTLKSDQLKDQPADYTRTLNALCRLTSQHLVLQKYQDTCAKEQAREPKKLDENREISKKERNIVLHRWQDFFGHDLTQPAPGCPTDSPAPLAQPLPSPTSEPPTPNNTTISVSSAPQDPAILLPETHPSEASHPSDPSDAPPLPIENQKSKTKNPLPAPPPTPQLESSLAPTPSIQNPATSTPPSPIETQPVRHSASDEGGKSKIKNSANPPSAGHCSACKLLLPPLLKNGERVIPFCPKCGNPLFSPPRWTPVDYPPPNGDPTGCDVCRQRHQLDPNGLPDPCPQCGLHLLTHPATAN